MLHMLSEKGPKGTKKKWKKKKRKSVAYDLTLLVLTGKMRCFEAVLSRVSIYLYTITLFTIK